MSHWSFCWARSRAPSLALAAAVLTAVSLPAALIPLDLDGLTARSQIVARGEVVSVRSYWGVFQDRDEVILTDVRIRVDATWKDIAGKHRDARRAKDGGLREVTLQFLGGQIGERRQLCLESPRFAKGEKVVVFLRDFNRRLWVTGWKQGKYRVLSSRVRQGATTRWIDTHVEGKAGLPIVKTIALDELRAVIRELARKSRRTDKTAAGARTDAEVTR